MTCSSRIVVVGSLARLPPTTDKGPGRRPRTARVAHRTPPEPPIRRLIVTASTTLDGYAVADGQQRPREGSWYDAVVVDDLHQAGSGTAVAMSNFWHSSPRTSQSWVISSS